jgi:hypothetical protein
MLTSGAVHPGTKSLAPFAYQRGALDSDKEGDNVCQDPPGVSRDR